MNAPTRLFYGFPALLIVAALNACGGGGGSAGTTGSISSGTTPSGSTVIVSKDPILKLALQDTSGAITTSISTSGYTLLTITLSDSNGRPIPNQVVDVTGDASKVIFPEGNTGLTNSAGVATVKLARASLIATGAAALTVTYSYKKGSLTNYFPDGSSLPTADTVVAAYLGYQFSAANITLTNMDVGAPTLAAYGTRQVAVQANINGVASTSTPIQVNFSATCGRVSPATASTNTNGVVLVTYAATDVAGLSVSTLGCSGKTVEINASTLGAAVLTKSLNITGAPASNMSFVGVTPTKIFLANSGGSTQAIAEFKVVNARGEALPGQEVLLTLKTLNGGIPKASLGAVGSVTSIMVTTNADGKVSVPVFSGTVPTNVIVNAALVLNPLVQTDSSILSIASGRPVQARVSLSLEKMAIEGASVDGESSTVTISLADRQGNPVPDGTAVNFVTVGGVMIPPTCTTGVVPGDSRCSVTIRSQNPRPANGRVSILAYVAGEEDFVDANFNNVYDCGEAFTDLGTAYRDDNENGIFDIGEFSVPRSASPSLCSSGTGPTPQAGDSVWGAADVRRQSIIIFATGITEIIGTFTSNKLAVEIRDLNSNSVPTGSTVTARTSSLSCSLDGTISTISKTVPNSLSPFFTSYATSGGCSSGDQIVLEVTTPSPSKTVTNKTFTLP